MMGKNGLSRFGRLPLVLFLAGLATIAAWLLLRPAFAPGTGETPAERALAPVLASLPWRGLLLETGGRAALAAGNPGGALAQFVAAQAYGPLTPAGQLASGDAHRLQGEWAAAILAWTAARDLGEDQAAVAYRLLEAHRTLRDYPAAIADLQTLTALDPQSADLHYQLGLLLSIREPEAALASLLQAAELDSRLQDAVRLFEQGLAPDPEIDDPAFVYFNAGRALASLSEWELAAEAFRQAVLANPQYAEAWAFLGEAYYRLGGDGAPMMATALELEPESLAVNLLQAMQLRRVGRPEEALPYLERAALAAPEAAAVAAETAQVYAEIGDVNEAVAYFLKAVELAPDDPAYLHLLAAFSIYNEVQVDAVGLPAARNAVLADEKDFVALDLIGYAYYVRGDWISGLRFLYRALDANPAYAPARLHLGMLFLAREDLVASLPQLELVVDLAPGSAAAVQAQEILDVYFPDTD